jgi:DNA-binding NtrC family response regulator
MKEQILVVDDQVAFCNHIRTIMETEGYEVMIAEDAQSALERISCRAFDILLTDMKLPDMDGLELFKIARKMDPHISCIIMTAYGSISSAVASVKEGVTDYLQKPFEPEALLMAVVKTLRERWMIEEIQHLRKEVDQKYAFGNIIGKSHKMQLIYDLIQKVAPTDARVLITGETGVGKELVAKAIHFNSPRKNKPFVAINCGALVETLLETELFGHEKGAFTGAVCTKKGKFEIAERGTLFLDEVGDVSPAMQVKLLRVLQEGKLERVGGNQPICADVRIIAATNQDLRERIRRNEFRLELFYRLNVVPIHIPPLRQRVEDIPLLVKSFLEKFNRAFNKNIRQISGRGMSQLMQHDWPGNVRELENVLERAFVVAEDDTIDRITLSGDMACSSPGDPMDSVNPDIPFSMAKNMLIKRFEKTYLVEVLRRHGGNVSAAASKTGINQRTLWRKIKEHNLDCSHFRRKTSQHSHVMV